MVLGDSGLTSSQFKPLAHFFEEFGDRCLNWQPFLVSAPCSFFFLPAVFFFYILILLPSPLLLISDVSTFQHFKHYKKKRVRKRGSYLKQKCSFPASFTYPCHCSPSRLWQRHQPLTHHPLVQSFMSGSQSDLTHLLTAHSPGLSPMG